jgi:hypothetical protein
VLIGWIQEQELTGNAFQSLIATFLIKKYDKLEGVWVNGVNL